MAAGGTFWARKAGSGGMARILTLILVLVAVACDTNISSKLEATKIVVPPDQGRTLEKEGMTVSIQPDTFSDPVEIKIESADGALEISTTTKAGAKVIAKDVLKDLLFCSVLDPRFD